MRIGIDIGTTSTEAVLMAGRDVIATGRANGEGDAVAGIDAAVAPLLATAHVRTDEIDAVMVCIGSLRRNGHAHGALRSIAVRLRRLKIDAPLFVGMHDGSVAVAEQVVQQPGVVFDAGVAMAMRGAHVLSDCDDAIVLNVGSHRTTIGIIKSGTIRLDDTRTFEIGGSEATMLLDKAATIGRESFGDREAPLVLVGSAASLVRGVERSVLLTTHHAFAAAIGVATATV